MNIVWCDGGSKGNGNEDQRGYGSALVGDKVLEWEFGNVTNNVAEFLTMFETLKYLKNWGMEVSAEIRTDSLLVVNHVSGKNKNIKPHLLPLRDECRKLLWENKLVWVAKPEILAKLGH